MYLDTYKHCRNAFQCRKLNSKISSFQAIHFFIQSMHNEAVKPSLLFDFCQLSMIHVLPLSVIVSWIECLQVCALNFQTKFNCHLPKNLRVDHAVCVISDNTACNYFSCIRVYIHVKLSSLGASVSEPHAHLIVRRKFVCPSVRLSVCPVWLTEHARENNTCSLLGHGHASLPIICACSNQMTRVKGDRENREERSKNEDVGSNIS